MQWGKISLRDENVFRFLVFGFLCFAVISWEIFEYITLSVTQDNLYSDTITDMICGLIGGLVAMVFFQRLDLGKNLS